MSDIAPDPGDVRAGVYFTKDGETVVGTYDGSDQFSNMNQLDVREGVPFRSLGFDYTGTLAVPSPSDVREGIPTDDTVGTLEVNSSVDLPSPSDVKHGVSVGSDIGTYRGADLYTQLQPSVVKNGTQYISDGTQRTGSYSALSPLPTGGTSAINFPAMEAKLASVISHLLTLSAGVTVPAIWANQGYPQPPSKPFASLNYTQGIMKTGHDSRDFDSNGNIQISGDREFILGVSVFGKGAYSMLTDLQVASEFDSVRDSFAQAGLVYVSTSAVRDLSRVEGAGYQTRGQMDITFRVNSLVVDNSSGYINSVNIENELDGSNSTVTG